MFHAALPQISKKKLEFPHFPTIQQAVVWRNWGLVPVRRIAETLAVSEVNIADLAREMGLSEAPAVSEDWLNRGYITIIRANWHLLPYHQLLKLLGWSAGKLGYILKEDDFLAHKLGNFKPAVEEVAYAPLTEEQKRLTRHIRSAVETHFPHSNDENSVQPFDFLREFKLRAPDKGEYGNEISGEIVLDSRWNFVYSDTAGMSDVFIQRFIANHESKWGVKLNRSLTACSVKSIVLDIREDRNKQAESHSIDISDDQITISAVDEVGLLRGLQWIEKAMDNRKGPFLSKGRITRDTRFDTRIVYSYSAVYGDPLLEPELDPYPEGLLDRLSRLGVNGIWLQGVLYNLVPWDEAPELSVNWEKRIEGLRLLVSRAARYGIGVYLYLNEPRAMPHAFFERHPDWKGEEEGDYSALCTSVQPVKDFLKNSAGRLFEQVPGLTGIITITMSENLTNCYSRVFEHATRCPRCAGRKPQDVISEVNALIAEGVRKAKPNAQVVCWTWGWQNTCGTNDVWVQDAVDLLPEHVSVMCTSEEAIETRIAGIHGSVLDYSMSVVGPGNRALDVWRAAQRKGLRTVAKVQFNNTWEISAVPYIPVPGLVEEHMSKLADAGVSGVMLGWTLGGYPSLNLEIASRYYWLENPAQNANLSEMMAERFGAVAGKIIHDALAAFGQAFRQFPFHIDVLYHAPQNYGPKNLLWLKPTGYPATMIGFPSDDLASWRGIYPEDVFEDQFDKLSAEWKRGLHKLDEAEVEVGKENMQAWAELKDIAEAVYCHFRSVYLQISFIRQRDSVNHTENLIRILDEEIEIAKALYAIVSRDSRIGYEASNHYYYTKQDLVEKVVNCEHLRNELIGEVSAQERET